MDATNEEINRSAYDITVIWLDAHIGNPDSYHHLKAAFSSNIDPTNIKPIELVGQHGTNTLFPRRIGIPCELRTFVDSESCLKCIRESLDANIRIYLITSDYAGRTLLPQIAEQYPEVFCSAKPRISFYIFTFDMVHSLDWLYDYIDCTLVFNHEADLLWRLVHDIAIYYTEIGKKLLTRDTLIGSHQALIYFEWANALSHHEKGITEYQDSKFIQDLEYLISHAEEKVKHSMSSMDNRQYSLDDMEKNLNSSILIYHSKELHEEAVQLLSILRNLTNEQGTLFDNYKVYVARMRSESCAIKQYCPIIISSNNDNQMKVVQELSSLASVNHIYILDPDVENDRSLLKSFSKVQNIYQEVKILALEWTIERTSTCEKIGEYCVENGDSDLARMYYAKTIRLNEKLSASIKNK